jgi:hypothetical protein
MAPKVYDTGILPLRTESGKTLGPVEVAAEIQNFEVTSQGTLRTVRGPIPVYPDYGDQLSYSYGNVHGVFHALLKEGKRDVLLAHFGDKVYVYDGWDQSPPTSPWRVIIGSTTGTPPGVAAELVDTTTPQFPTQFELVSNGIVIMPQNGSRAFFYDGEVCTELGYDAAPGAPYAYGPDSTTTTLADMAGDDNGGFDISGETMQEFFGKGRLGTVGTEYNENGAAEYVLKASRYAYAYRWVDRWGNMSPLSARSNTINWRKQSAEDFGDSADATSSLADARLKQLTLANVQPGPERTIGRDVYRTRDLLNSGFADLYNILSVSGGTVSANKATIPDNSSTLFPDNNPDSWLVLSAEETDPMPAVRFGRLAFGRMWYNPVSNPSALIGTLPGRWGTPERNQIIFPDASGGALTGAWPTQGGLLVFTQTSTFLLVPFDDGIGFRAATLDASKGCVAPSSIANLPNGTVMWLGREGFYLYDGQQIVLASEAVRELTERINAGRALQACAAVDPTTREYRCWVPIDGSRENNLCLIWDGDGWRRRTGENLVSVCVTKDHRSAMIGGGIVNKGNGVFVLDRESNAYTAPTRESVMETTWLEWPRSRERKSPMSVYVLLREYSNATFEVEVYRDWRKTKAVYTTKATQMVSPEDVPALWGTTEWDQAAEPNQWVKRRPFWKQLDVYVPSCETYKIRISTTAKIEFVALSVDEMPKAERSRIP